MPEHVAIAIKKEALLTTVIPVALLPGKSPGTPSTEGLVGPMGFWTGLLNIIFLAPHRYSKPEPSTP